MSSSVPVHLVDGDYLVMFPAARSPALACVRAWNEACYSVGSIGSVGGMGAGMYALASNALWRKG